MGIELATHPEWELEEFRQELRKCLLKLMGEDAPRLKSLDVAHYVPPTTQAAIELERRGLPKGGVVQVVGYVCRPGDAESGELFRCEVPRLLKWATIPALAQQMITPICKSLGKLDREAKAKRGALEVRSCIVGLDGMRMAMTLPEVTNDDWVVQHATAGIPAENLVRLS